uniref:Uncharacterized protein n=1 Tax=Panagrolaimus superbus TaxID=310955 RepID=A0A914Z1F9_9BILA
MCYVGEEMVIMASGFFVAIFLILLTFYYYSNYYLRRLRTKKFKELEIYFSKKTQNRKEKINERKRARRNGLWPKPIFNIYRDFQCQTPQRESHEIFENAHIFDENLQARKQSKLSKFQQKTEKLIEKNPNLDLIDD